jgi:hypothetical protein
MRTNFNPDDVEPDTSMPESSDSGAAGTNETKEELKARLLFFGVTALARGALVEIDLLPRRATD